jgi:hypothetical protein
MRVLLISTVLLLTACGSTSTTSNRPIYVRTCPGSSCRDPLVLDGGFTLSHTGSLGNSGCQIYLDGVDGKGIFGIYGGNLGIGDGVYSQDFKGTYSVQEFKTSSDGTDITATAGTDGCPRMVITFTAWTAPTGAGGHTPVPASVAPN